MLLRRENILGFRLLANNSKIPITAIGWIFSFQPNQRKFLNWQWTGTMSESVTLNARNSLDFLARLMCLEGHNDTEIHFCKTWGLKISQTKMQIMSTEIFQLPIKHHTSQEWKDTLSLSSFPKLCAHLSHYVAIDLMWKVLGWCLWWKPVNYIRRAVWR